MDKALFVPQSQKAETDQDYPLPIGSRQTISQPTLVAHMTELLQLKRSDKVLQIGTGSGYQTAILAELCKHVYTIEIIKALYKSGKTLLESFNYKNITINHASGYEGWLEKAPFDKIIVTCAPAELPQILLSQLKKGGRMIIPVGIFEHDLLMIAKNEFGIICTLPTSSRRTMQSKETPILSS